VKEARNCQQQQVQEEEQQRIQKAERGCVQEDQKQAKLQVVQQRPTARAAAWVVRKKDEARKATKQVSRAAVCRTQQQLQQALKTAQKSKTRSLKAGSKNRAAAQPEGSIQASDAAAAPLPS
jgi:hypothetical protein